MSPTKKQDEDPRLPTVPLRVLLVDDEEIIRVTLAEDLKEVGHRVASFEDGSSALKALDEQAFDVVISDLRMPGADGMAVLQAARERHSETEVVLITAHGSVENAVEAMRQGAYHYVVKPFLNDEILMLLAQVARLKELERKNRALTEDLGRM